MPPIPTPVGTRASVSYDSDRRLHQRYSITLDVEYEVLDGTGLQCRGYGHTINISSGGILFDTQNRFTVGQRIELSIPWPCLLRGSVHLKSVFRGNVVRQGSRSQSRSILTTLLGSMRNSGVSVFQP